MVNSSSDLQLLLEASEEEWIKKGRELCACVLSKASLVQSFRGKWIVIRERLGHLSEMLASLSESSPLQRSLTKYKSVLPQIVGSLEEGKKLAEKSIDLSYGGKLLMQSNLDAFITKLDFHLRDLGVMQEGIWQHDRALAIVTVATTNQTRCKNHRKVQIWELFTRLRTGKVDEKKAALDGLIQFLKEDEDSALLVANEGDIRHLINFLDSSCSVIRETAAHAVSIMAMMDKCRKTLIAEGVLQPLIRILESQNSHAKEKAALALFELTRVADNAHAVASYHGIPLLVKLCRDGTPGAIACAAGTLSNLARNEHIRRSIANYGAVEALVGVLTHGTTLAQDHAAEALQNLASGKDDRIRVLIARHGGIQSLLAFLKRAVSPKAQETAIHALSSLATSAGNAKALVSVGYVDQLTGLSKARPSRVQQLAAKAIANLSPHIDHNKRVAQADYIKPLSDLLNQAKDSSQERAVPTLSTFLLVNSTRKEEKGTMRLMQLLGPHQNQSLAKRFSMSALLATSGKKTFRNRIMSAETKLHNEKPAEVSVSSMKKNVDKMGRKKLLSIFTRQKAS